MISKSQASFEKKGGKVKKEKKKARRKATAITLQLLLEALINQDKKEKRGVCQG